MVLLRRQSIQARYALAFSVMALGLVAGLQQCALAQKPDAVEVTKSGTEVEVTIAGKLFTRYTSKCAPNKPIFYPILTPEGNNLTRRWPVEPDAVPGESHDHVHHRGLWFTHSNVNGIDFWSEEGKNIGKTVTTSITNVHSGAGNGGFTAHTEWRSPDGTLMARDTRVVTIRALPNGARLLDFRIRIVPEGKPLVFGDNKDGTFGLRVPDSLAVHPSVKPAVTGSGHILTSTGARDTEAWGKAADWVDYWGPIDGKVHGVAIFDSPHNFRHPQTWHARDYGLFCVNPFALHDFNLGPKGAGDYTVEPGKSLDAEYGVYFHAGDASAANVAQEYLSFVDLITHR